MRESESAASQEDKTPNPGSDEAIEKGCTCAVLDNGHGRGYMGQEGIFVISGNCALHGLGSNWGRFVPEDDNG